MDIPTPSPPTAPAAARGPRAVRRVTWIGAAVNVALSAAKLVAGVAGSSQAVVADAVHSLSDLATDVAVLVGVRYWSAPADPTHPHGHQRIETLVTALIGAALAAVAVGIGYNALASLPERHAQPPGLVALAAALASIVTKEVLYRWTARVGRRVKSPAVIANAWHHRSDALSSIPASAAVLMAIVRPGWAFVDHVGAIIVSLFILQAAWKITRPALEQLVDRGAPEPDRQAIEALVLATAGVRAVHAIRTRYVGGGLAVDLHILVDPDLTVRAGHAISHDVKARLLAHGPDVVDAIVHLEPYEPPAPGPPPPATPPSPARGTARG